MCPDLMCVAEKDVNSDVVWTWSYPAVDEEVREMIMRKCCLSSQWTEKEAADSQPLIPFTFGHFSRTWYYVQTEPVESELVLDKVTHVSLVLLTKVTY